MGEIENLTNLTRRTIVDILQKIKENKFYLLRKNPEEFIDKCSKIINEAKASLIINNIVYHKIEDNYDAKTVFTNDHTVLRDAINLKKHVYDYLTSDSKIESKFADVELRGTENLKIHCARVHFEEISGSEVKYDVVESYDKLMDLVQFK